MAYAVGFLDGFDHYDPGGPWRKWAVPAGTITTTPGPVHGRAAVFAGGGVCLTGEDAGPVTSRGCALFLRIRSSTWGSAARVVPVQLLLGTAIVKQSLAITPDGKVAVWLGDAPEDLLAETAPGVFPFDRWVHLNYSSALWPSGPDGTTPGGRVDVFLDGASVLTREGTATVAELPYRQDRQRIGNCLADGNAVVVELDDYCHFYSFATDFPEPNAPLFSGSHAVLTLYPTAAGDADDLALVGAATNWQACAEAVADGDTTRVEKSGGTDQKDLYRMGVPGGGALPALPPDYAAPDYDHFACVAGGLLRDDGGVFSRGSLLMRYTDPDGEVHEYSNRGALTGVYRFLQSVVGWTQPEVASLQVGWGRALGDVADGLQDDFCGSQVVAEVWYPATPAPAPPAGGPRWSVGWLG